MYLSSAIAGANLHSADLFVFSAKSFSRISDRSPCGNQVHLSLPPSACHHQCVTSKMHKEYVTNVAGAYMVTNTRVSLDSLIYLFREGMSAESMVESYPAVTLEQVHGALAYYLGNQKEIDEYLTQGQRVAESQHEQSRQTNAEMIAKLQRARHASQIPG